jgi:hypothetical protein
MGACCSKSDADVEMEDMDRANDATGANTMTAVNEVHHYGINLAAVEHVLLLPVLQFLCVICSSCSIVCASYGSEHLHAWQQAIGHQVVQHVLSLLH